MARVKAALERAAADAGKGRPAVDGAAVAGLICGAVVLAVTITLGGSPAAFLNGPAILIVLGGTLSAVMVSFSVAEVVEAARLCGEALSRGARNASEAAVRMLHLADIARQQGILPLETVLPELEDGDPFLHKGLGLVVDGMHASEVEAIMTQDLEATADRWVTAVSVLRRAAEYAPAMGLIGTLIGLVQMLGRLDDPAVIGPSMAIALLTTLYGAVLANLVLSPLAAKVERKGAGDVLVNQIAIMGATSISRLENPRRLEMLLNSLLPPAQRVQYFN